MRAPLRPCDAKTLVVQASFFKASRAQRVKTVSAEDRVKVFFRRLRGWAYRETDSDDYTQAAYCKSIGVHWPIRADSSWELVNTWLWFSTGRVTPLVRRLLANDLVKCKVGTFKDATVAWAQLSVDQQLALLAHLWRDTEVSRYADKCDAYDLAAEGANAFKAALGVGHPDYGRYTTYARLDAEVLGVMAWERCRRCGERAATTIQRRWRHRCWCVKELWNPNTPAGARWLAAIAGTDRWAR